MKYFAFILIVISFTARGESFFIENCNDVNSGLLKVDSQISGQIDWLKKIFNLSDCHEIEQKLETIRSFKDIIPSPLFNFSNKNTFKPLELTPTEFSLDPSKYNSDEVRKTFSNLKLFKEFKNLTNFIFEDDIYDKQDLCEAITEMPYISSITIGRVESENNIRCIIEKNLKIFILGEYKPSNFTFRIKDQIYGIDNYVGEIEVLHMFSRLIYLGLENYSGTASLKVLSENKNLTSLHVNIRSISNPEDISFLPYLSYLSLNCYEVENSMDSSENHENNCNKRSIKNIQFLSSLVYLKGLDLSQNSIQDLSPLTNLTLLDQLNMRSNKVNKLPHKKILQKLKFLDLADNQITEMWDIQFAKKLQYLNFSKNRISKLPKISGLNELRFLSIGSNPIDNINELAPPKNLRLMDIDSRDPSKRWNEINKYSSSIIKSIFANETDYKWAGLILFSEDKRIRVMTSPKPQIFKQNFDLKKFKNIEVLSLANTKFPEVLNVNLLSKLKFLDVSNATPPDSFPESLEFLNLRKSSLINLNFTRELQYLKTLDLSENDFEVSPKFFEIKSLETLRVEKCNIKNADFLVNFPNLLYLDINNNLLTTFDQTSFKLHLLDLSYNQLDNVPDFSNYTNLDHVFLNFNYISNLDVLANWPPRKVFLSIDLYNNKIENLFIFKSEKLIYYTLALKGNRVDKNSNDNCPKDSPNKSVSRFCSSN